MNKRIVIALSGGVDSSVAAYLLQKQGYEVKAVFMQNWDDFLGNSSQSQAICSQTQDWNDAKLVAQKLNIPIFRINFIREYWDQVFTNFLTDLKKGLTPNPDILCNKIIKFNYFVEYVKKHFSPDFLATGHYAKIVFDSNKKRYYLSKPFDQAKDQTYFLCQINPLIFGQLIFPLSDLTKQEVRQIAHNLSLINAQKKDSTGICFIGERNFSQFLSRHLENKEGNIIDIDSGKIKAKHRGIHYFTIGQRQGIGLGGEKHPYYVVGKDVKKNAIYVAKGWENPWLYSNHCWVEKINWLINENELIDNFNSSHKITAKFRYRQSDVTVKIFPEKEQLKVKFTEPQRAITPGQYAVFYKNDICLGGGVISTTEKIDHLSRPIVIL